MNASTQRYEVKKKEQTYLSKINSQHLVMGYPKMDKVAKMNCINYPTFCNFRL